MDSAVRHLASTYAPKGTYIGALMLASLFVEAWDFYCREQTRNPRNMKDSGH